MVRIMNALGLAQVIEHCKQQGTLRATPRQWQVLNHICDCRTSAMGATLYRCDACHSQWLWYHSCRDRHCPQCQTNASRAWCEKQKEQLLPVPYFHLVFTLPHELNDWVTYHADVIYRLLFQSCWKTLHVMGQRKLQGQLGMTAVLHTWGQQLTRHVHLHCLIPSGVMTSSQSWKSRHKRYLLPVKALSRRFRGVMVSALRETKQKGELSSIGANDFDRTLTQLMSKPWCVYSKAAIQYRETLVNYLARYSHRIGLSNHRLLESTPNQVTLAYHDYRSEKNGRLQLTPEELIRRFLLHILPKGFMRIRHYGFLANAIKRRCLLLIREQLGRDINVAGDQEKQVPSSNHAHCPSCGHEPVTCLGECTSESMITLRNEVSLALLNSS